MAEGRLALAEALGSSRMVLDEHGAERLPAGEVPACRAAAGEEAATSRPRQL